MTQKILSTLNNFNGLFHSLFWDELKRSIGVKGLNQYKPLSISQFA